MKKTIFAGIFWTGAIVCLVASGLLSAGIIPVASCAVLVVIAFPPTLISLFAWWMAGQSGGDIPFIGY